MIPDCAGRARRSRFVTLSTSAPLARLAALAGLVGLASLVGCAGGSTAAADSPRVVAKATDAQTAAMLGRVKSLAGEWTKAGPDGGGVTAAVVSVSSAGTVVREIMFPGSPHEMTNVYHMDGPDLVMTHYCAGGNQPRMRCTPADASPDRLVFRPDSVTNLTSADQSYMAGMTLEFKPDGGLVQRWVSRAAGKDKDYASFELRRKAK